MKLQLDTQKQLNQVCTCSIRRYPDRHSQVVMGGLSCNTMAYLFGGDTLNSSRVTYSPLPQQMIAPFTAVFQRSSKDCKGQVK